MITHAATRTIHKRDRLDRADDGIARSNNWIPEIGAGCHAGFLPRQSLRPYVMDRNAPLIKPGEE
jgi:hypothetical protein